MADNYEMSEQGGKIHVVSLHTGIAPPTATAWSVAVKHLYILCIKVKMNEWMMIIIIIINHVQAKVFLLHVHQLQIVS